MRSLAALSVVATWYMGVAQGPALPLDDALSRATLAPTTPGLALTTLERGLVVTFPEGPAPRRFIGVAMSLPHVGFEPQSLRAAVRLTGVPLGKARLACILWGDDGQAWYALHQVPQAAFEGEWAVVWLPVSRPVRAAFSRGQEPFDWSTVSRLWLGAIIDSPGEGSVSLREPLLSSEPFHASEPLALVEPGRPAMWEVGADPRVQWTLQYPAIGPAGEVVSEVRFRFPGGAHMYLTPGIGCSNSLEGYQAMRLVYQATLPPGIDGLLVMLGEDAAQFQGPAPPGTGGQWSEVLLDLSEFRLGAWSTDDGQLDLAGVNRVYVGAHGTAEGDGGEGLIRVATIEFVPPTPSVTGAEEVSQ